LNLRPLGPQPSALPDCATPRGYLHFDASPTRRSSGERTLLSCEASMGTSVRIASVGAYEDMWPLQQAEGRRRFCLAPESPGAAGQLLPPVSRRVQAGTLRGQQAEVHRFGAAAQEGHCCRAHRVSRGLSTRASLRGLRRGRSCGAGVRPSSGQEIQHREDLEGPQMADRPRRDGKVRGRLCKLSSAPHRTSGRLHPRGGSSTVEPRPSKAMMRVQFPSAAFRRVSDSKPKRR
jgi:hypothetical protein